MSHSNPSFKLETDLLALRSFVAVVEEGGFSAAAKRVHRSQSAISLQIAKLEDRLHNKLLERTSRSVTMTPAGETFLSYARRILALADEASLAVSAPDEPTRLRVGFADYLAPLHLPALLARFRRAHPNCDLTLNLGLGGPLLTSLQKDELDLVFAGPESPAGQLLWEEQLVWTGHLPAEGSSTPLDLVLMPSPCSYRAIAFDTLAKINRTWKLSIEANSVQAVESTLQAGLGLSVLPRSAVPDSLPIIREGLPELPKTSVRAHRNPNQEHNPYLQRFIDFLVEGMDAAA
ncbi:LysR family transcriptional regulator [Roseibacillus ishigakijimensis]|uniref:LysR family transcriptional regulator n=1 Tax=Roseibacillus ishigakijimensis TaxID=454146 RepID=A0A934VHD7_9BACT|nr:LysR family transcriptional regulator [Roseibacillus ishigakijimensis]MBK1833838.1 LysR family transcriptional regulator [Roseibacillus ishigakijimensis]